MANNTSTSVAALTGAAVALGAWFIVSRVFGGAATTTAKPLQPPSKVVIAHDKAFVGKRALVTGAGKGIGREICMQLARSGAYVVAISRTQSDLASLKRELDKFGNGSQVIAIDLAQIEDTRSALESVGDVDLLVNNAGVTRLAPFVDATLEDWDSVMNTNLRSVFVVSQIIAKKMIAKGTQGSIVNISSQASMVGLDKHAAYCASKGGLDQLTRAMALELGRHGIRVNSINPTVVLTDMGKMAWSSPSVSDPMRQKIPLGKFAEPEDVAHAVLYLLSENAAMINGVILPVDGGFLATR